MYNKLIEKNDDMASLLRDLIQTSGADREERAMLHRDLNEPRQKHDALLAKNSAFETEVKELKHRLNNYFLPTDTRDKCLVMGSSLVRDFDEEWIHETEVRYMRGAKISDLTKEVEAHKGKSASFSRIVLLAGGNYAAADPDESDLESAIDNNKSLVNAAKEISQNIAITEIPPRFQPPHAQENINASNANLESVAQELGTEFLRNDNIFFLHYHEVNDGYMLDTVQLNMKGSNKLAKSMGLISKNNNDYHVCSRKPRQSSSFTWNSPKPTADPNSRYNADQRESSGAAHQSSSGVATRPANS